MDCGNETLPVRVRADKRARRITLRFNPWSRDIVVTLPRRVPVSEGLAFAETKKAWLKKLIDQSPQKILFEEGAVIAILGRPYHIAHRPGRGGVVSMEGDTLYISGAKEFMARRLRDWLKDLVREIIVTKAYDKAALLEKNVRHVTVRDTRSRWGSCSHDGRLSFSWRLVFATPEVLDYVVSHEVAHLAEMNHSAKFWKQVALLCPEWETCNGWLKHHGHILYAYG